MLFLLFGFGFLIIIVVLVRSTIQSAYLENYQFIDIVIAKFKEKHKNLTDADIELVIKGLKNYFYISSRSSDIIILPSIVLDDLWHEFILYSKEYNSFCNEAFGRFLHHSPNDTKSFDVDMARFLAWEESCKLEGLNPSTTSELPLIFKIDELLKIKNGLYYSVSKERYWYKRKYERLEKERASNCASCG